MWRVPRGPGEVAPDWFVHQLRIADSSDIDDELWGWIAESYRLMGMQERLQ